MRWYVDVMNVFRAPAAIIGASLLGLVASAAVFGLVPVLGWLSRPWNDDRAHHVAGWVAWHARFMVAGWVVAIPLGIIAARFFKVLPWQRWPKQLDNRAWWHSHKALQSGGYLLALVGLGFMLRHARGASPAAAFHVAGGWIGLVLGGAQILSGMARGSRGAPADPKAGTPVVHGDHYDMTPRRIAFERFHKSAGYAAVFVSWAAVMIGLAIVNAPRWMWLVIGLWWLMMLYWFCVLQRQGRCRDTYQAIWGPGRDLPGNRIAPIGLGIRRDRLPPERQSPWQGRR